MSKQEQLQTQLQDLIDSGYQVRQTCFTSSQGLEYISGTDYVTWIQKCKRFLKQNIHDKDFIEEFEEIANKAEGNSDDYFDRMIGMLRSWVGEDIPESVNPKDENAQTKIEKIFISHASKDIEYVKALVSLLNDIGVKKNQNNIFCSSLPGYDIPHGESIYEFLKKELNKNNIMVLFVLSDNYYQSAPCLNEMGAAWITSKESTTVLTPNFDFKQIAGAIDPTKISFKMNNSVGLDKFRDSIIQTLELAATDYKIWQGDKKNYLSKIIELADSEASTLNTNIELEKVKRCGTDQIELQLRFINVTEKEIEFQYIDVELADENGEKLCISVSDELLDDIKLMSKENKIISMLLPYDSSSNYQVRRNVSKNAKIKFAIS
ncbi:toll/interleukin-1 receptor domain-containing protein (plasmid) [Bacillus sp. N5-665]|uniref:toll/interleukin-1 receptor domain-containing protein n=1 Tax=Bacillus sp. N5-665 TaxID=2925318 RepID=UPI001F52C8A9|nr:toll/interleukin-1 receptor domain-containing protein [Bacillus sp. N5-665]UNK30997.1 toll/interleukin-1 receptor domain-containing protein [Bacillus sp. N5-665]